MSGGSSVMPELHLGYDRQVANPKSPLDDSCATDGNHTQQLQQRQALLSYLSSLLGVDHSSCGHEYPFRAPR